MGLSLINIDFWWSEGAVEPFTVIGRNLEIHYGTTFYKHGFEIPDGVLCEHVYLPCSIVIR